MFFYFKKVDVIGVENIPKNKAVLLLGNHQNALLDALLIAIKCGRFSYFLTRAAVFKNPFVSKLLKSLQMLPVYRIRDGWSNLTNNNAIFETCTKVLHDKEAVVIFPEGSHNLARRVRPLSKGFTRIVFDTLDTYPDLDIQMVPVGLNFLDATGFPDSAAMYFGEAISAQDYISENRNDAVVHLKERIKSELSELTTNIPEGNYDDILQKLDALNVDYLKPKDVNHCIQSNFKNCVAKHNSRSNPIQFFFKLLLIINIFVPYLIWKYLVKPKVEEPEFIATFRFAVALTLVPLYLIFSMLIITWLSSLTFGLIYLISVLLIALLAVKL
ncbi:MAG: 1-acyl-sn-glycerol-3-phosphate acyltransferase [Flavobacteriaceae bacterium]|nr:1-acyl-sn-glycerol-3-phosphate acyltransferase [Flavobacteriaceae bacterium]